MENRIRDIYYSIFKQPDDPQNTILWRYLLSGDPDKVSWFFENAALWFTPAEHFKDTLEGTLTEPSKVDFAKFQRSVGDEGGAEREGAITASLKAVVNVNCWHMNTRESLEMWSVYCPDDHGIAITTTYQKLHDITFGAEQEKFFIGIVEYIDHEARRIGLRNAFSRFMIKDAKLAYEREARIVCTADPGEHACLMVDPDVIVERIVLHPLADQTYRNWIEALVVEHAPSLLDRIEWSQYKGKVTTEQLAALRRDLDP